LSRIVGEIILLSSFQIDQAGTIITGGAISMEIYYKCTGIYQMAGFMAAVLAFPTTFQNKMIGFAWGICGISILNLVRILSIFYVGYYYPAIVPVFHGIIWEALMILFSLLLWMWWANKNAQSFRRAQPVAISP
jgi:exosortase/archaeosortase family protein